MKKFLAFFLIVTLAFAMIVPVSAAEGDDDDVLYQRILKALKTDKAPNMEEIDESWGDSLIYVVESMPDAKLVTYWNGSIYPQYNNPDIVPESCEFDFYCRWDAKYLYLGVKSPDTEPSGWVEPWCGDGVQMWIKYRNAVEDPYEHYYQNMFPFYWTLAFDDYSVDTGDVAKECECYITFDDEYMHATIAIPWANIGIGRGEVADGLPLALVLMRISSRSQNDMGYAGWMNWGFDYVITLVLDDPEVEDKPLETIPTTAKPPVYDTDPPEENPEDTGAAETDPAETDPAEITPPETDPPATEAPATEAPATEAPATEAPATEAPATEAPATEAPATEAPATEAPATEAPATEAPATEAPATEAPVVVPETPAEIVAAAYALEDGEALPYTSTLTGVINAINTEWSEQYGNITVTMTVEGKDMMCYRLQGDGAKDLAIGDTITVTGTIKNYKGTIEFDAKCNLDAVVKATPAETEAPATEAPVTEAPATEAPATEAPATEAPKVEEPVEKNNTGLIIAIVAVVVVVGAGLGIVLGKKKK